MNHANFINKMSKEEIFERLLIASGDEALINAYAEFKAEIVNSLYNTAQNISRIANKTDEIAALTKTLAKSSQGKKKKFDCNTSIQKKLKHNQELYLKGHCPNCSSTKYLK